MEPPSKPLSLQPVALETRRLPDGGLVLRSRQELQPYARSLGELLRHWARTAPERVFLAEREAAEGWRRLTYRGALDAAERIAGALQPALAAERLTAGQLGVLQAIAERGPTSLRELGQRLFRSGPNMTIVVDNLERAGLVRRVRSDADRRVVLVEGTKEGVRRLRRAHPAYLLKIRRFLDVLAPAEQAELARLCAKLRAG